jgi:hypothetical protein
MRKGPGGSAITMRHGDGAIGRRRRLPPSGNWSLCHRGLVIALAGALVGLALSSIEPLTPAHAATSFTYGEGTAESQSLDIDVVDSGANINVYDGQATAGYQDTAAYSGAANVYVPLSGLLGSLQVCSQAAPNLPVPAPLTARTSTNGNTAPVSASDSVGGGVGGARSVQASPRSNAMGRVTATSFALPGVVDMSGGQSEAAVSADAGTMTRTATASTGLSVVSLLGGAVKLTGLNWRLQQSEVGADNRSDQRTMSDAFSLGSISVGPVTIPVSSPAQLPEAVATANGMLAPLGLALKLPTATKTAGGGNLSPLTVAVGGDKAVWGPVIASLLANTTFTALEQKMTGLLFDPQNCNELAGLLKSTGQLNAYWNLLGEGAPLVIGLLGQALGGSGEIDFNIGGVTSSLDDTYYPPFNLGIASLPALPSVTQGVPSSPDFTGVPAVPSGTNPPAAPDTASPQPSAALIARVSAKCETTSPAGQPMCWVGQAPIGAAVTGAVILGLLAADETYRRRHRKAGTLEDDGVQ